MKHSASSAWPPACLQQLTFRPIPRRPLAQSGGVLKRRGHGGHTVLLADAHAGHVARSQQNPQNLHGRASAFSCSSLPWAPVAAAPLVLRRCLGVEELQLDPPHLMAVCACSAHVSSGSVLRDSLKSVPSRPSLPRLSAQAQGCDITGKLARTTIPDAAQLSAPHSEARNPETLFAHCSDLEAFDHTKRVNSWEVYASMATPHAAWQRTPCTDQAQVHEGV